MTKFNVGDKVKVTGKGSKEYWGNAMKKYIGEVGTVYNVDSNHLWLFVLFKDKGGLWYVPDNLELVEESEQEEKVQV